MHSQKATVGCCKRKHAHTQVLLGKHILACVVLVFVVAGDPVTGGSGGSASTVLRLAAFWQADCHCLGGCAANSAFKTCKPELLTQLALEKFGCAIKISCTGSRSKPRVQSAAVNAT